MKEREFIARVTAVWAELHSLQKQGNQLSQQIAELEQAGFVNATIYIRKDTGGMELLHPMGSEYEVKTGRRREYVGTKLEQQETAKARVERWKQWQQLKRELQKVTSKQASIERNLKQLELAARGEQRSFFSDVGTNQPGSSAHIVPSVTNISPRGVVEYFKNSPDLAFVAEDVEETLKKVA